MNGRAVLKTIFRGVATVAITPALISFWVRGWVFGADRALEGSTQALSLLPGVLGQYLRRAFLTVTLAHCDVTATIEFGTVFSQRGARIGARAYIGPRCHIGLADIEEDVLIAAGVHIPSGAHTHAIDDASVPIREQAHRRSTVRIGSGSWIGNGAVIMADVGRNTIVGAGAVVTRPIEDNVVAAGVPARVIRRRDGVPHLATSAK
jgi:acetyltransferase-like isoleucine patch superfamily enzyme